MNTMNKLHGLWIGRLNDANSWYHVYPFAASNYNEHLSIVRYKSLKEKLPNTTYHISSSGNKVMQWLKLLMLGLKVAKQKKVDYIVSFSLVPWGLVGWLIAKIRRKPFILGFIGSDFHQSLAKSKFKHLLLYTVKKSEVITITGSSMLPLLIKKGINKKKIFTFPHCVRDELYIHELKEKREIDLITASRLIKLKRIHHIILALDLLHKKGKRFNLTILGDGDEMTELVNLTNELGLKSYVTFVGYTTDVYNYLLNSKFYIQASEFEGLSLSLIESMVAGVIPIATNVGSEHDIITHKKNGYLISKKGTPLEFAEAIEYCLKNGNYQQLQNEIVSNRNKFNSSHAISQTDKILDFIS